jgi:hypothetical protein
MPEKIIIYPKQKIVKNTIKDDCYKYFEQDLTIREIVDTYGFNESSVKYYRSKFVAEQVYKYTKRGDEFILGLKTPYSLDEMDYGTTPPVYTWESLEPIERLLIKHKQHKQLSKNSYICNQ